MLLGERLGVASLIVGLLGIAFIYLWPTKKYIGWLCLIAAIFSGLGWWWYELHPASSFPYPKERAYVGSNITPEYLSRLFDGHTQLQTQSLTNIYIGKWMRVSGRVEDVSSGSRTMSATLELSRIHLYPKVSLTFDKVKWNDRISILTVGDDIVVDGRISNIGQTWTYLEDCEILEH